MAVFTYWQLLDRYGTLDFDVITQQREGVRSSPQPDDDHALRLAAL
jgi:hypothetical protein